MGFKEQIQNDLEIFFNSDEFAGTHRIEGKELEVIIEENTLNPLKQGEILGLIEADMLIIGKEADFSKKMEPGYLLNVDGKEMIIIKSAKNMGVIEIALSQNRQ